MEQEVCGGRPFFGVEHEHVQQQVELLGREFGQELLVVRRLELGEGLLEVLELLDAFPVRRGGRACELENFEELADLGVSFEQRPAQEHFREGAAERPDVERHGVEFLPEQQLRRLVVEAADLRERALRRGCTRGGGR